MGTPILSQSLGDYLKIKLEYWLYEKLSRRARGYFLRQGDENSTYAGIGRIYEADVTALIQHLSANGLGDFFIDVGTNLGLMTLQCGGGFKEVHCFEPNGDVFKVLEVNTRYSGAGNATLYPFGIGKADGSLELSVPRHNFGGAFVREGNSYSTDLLAEKDQLAVGDDNQYFSIPISIRCGREVFNELFTGFRARGLKGGVIKIDVEGYEPVVLDELAAADRAGLNIAVVFENWDPKLDLDSIFSRLGATDPMILRSNSYNAGPLAKIMRIITQGRIWELHRAGGDNIGNLLVGFGEGYRPPHAR
ncbi:MAG: FkbM family methyltransferase [Caulobacteraceae bacterium]